jgi:hypothetical protein
MRARRRPTTAQRFGLGATFAFTFTIAAFGVSAASPNVSPGSVALPARVGGTQPGGVDPRGVRTPAHPSYVLDLTSDSDGFVWTGSERVTFKNVDPDPLKKVWLRLWDNGLSGCDKPLPIRVSHLKGGTPGDLSVDCTALPVILPSPVREDETATLSFALTITTPDINWRFGRIGSMALLGNAIPVLAIRDNLGWHLEPYTPNGESFYSQVGDFTVTFTTPRSLKIPATGTVTRSRSNARMRTITFVAHDVRDFAWASGPLSEEGGTSPSGVLVKVWWTDPITQAQADSMLSVGKAATASHALAYGRYRYPEVDVVLGVYTRFGGMEYPQLVMSDVSTSVLVHELAHQWWFGMVGDDQYNEPWLDEAFASYATDLYFGNHGESCDGVHWPDKTARITNSMMYWDEHPYWYGLVVYTLGSCALHDLSRRLGDDVMAAFMHHYAAEHSLAWSTTDAFKAEAQKVADGLPNPIDLTRFWKRHRIDDVP